MEWWKEFFGEDYLLTYLQYDNERAPHEAENIESILRLSNGAKILDLCCGYGRHSILLARKGYRVTGLDWSEILLTKARKDVINKGVEIKWIRSDMRSIPFQSEFNAVINMFTSFGFFEKDEDNLKVLKEVHKSLRRGGKFLLDTVNRERIIRAFQSRNWGRVDKSKFVLDNRELDLVKGRIYTKHILLSAKNIKERFFSLRLYSLVEIISLLKESGLVVKEIFGGLDKSEYGFNSPRMVILARND